MLLALGRGITADQIRNNTTWQIDIAPTVGDLLDFQTPLATGTSLLENPTLIYFDENSEPISEYNLEQNYPNPFNPSTKIGYSVPQKSYVLLQVYDLLGKHITTLVNEEKNAGRYEILFNGSKLQSGIYFYKLISGNVSDIKKMILAK